MARRPPPEPKRRVKDKMSMSDIDIEIKNSPALSYMMHETNILRGKVKKLEEQMEDTVRKFTPEELKEIKAKMKSIQDRLDRGF